MNPARPFGAIDLRILDMCEAFFHGDYDLSREILEEVCADQDGRWALAALCTSQMEIGARSVGADGLMLVAIMRHNIEREIQAGSS